MRSLFLVLLLVGLAAATALAQTGNAQPNPAAAQSKPGEPAPQKPGEQPGEKPAPAAEPATPHTVIYDDKGASGNAEPGLFETTPLPEGEGLTLVGGRVERIDRVRNRLTLRPFGRAAKMTFNFDDRSRILRDGVQTTHLGIREGDRVYVDSMLLGDQVFAKTIRVRSQGTASDASGQLLRYDAGSRLLIVNDPLSSQPVRFRVDDNTRVRQGQQPVTLSQVKPGALLHIRFAADGGSSVARDIEIRAMPGQRFQFVGRITHLDLRAGLLVVHSETDNRSYEIRFTPGRPTIPEDELVIGARIGTSAHFNGRDYRASDIQVLEQAAPAAER